MARCPPEYPTAVAVTPSTLAKSISTCQKQPAPKIAFSMPLLCPFSAIRYTLGPRRRSPVPEGPEKIGPERGRNLHRGEPGGHPSRDPQLGQEGGAGIAAGKVLVDPRPVGIGQRAFEVLGQELDDL